MSEKQKSILNDEKYLKYTYSNRVAPPGDYPNQLAKWLLDNVYKKTGKIADFGCGRGDYLEVFKNLGFEPYGFDISPSINKLTKYKVKQVDFTEGPEGQKGRFLSEARKDVTMDQETSTRFINKALKGSKTADFLGSVSTAATLLTLSGGKDFWNMKDAQTPLLDKWFNRGGDTSLMNKSLQYYQPHYPGRPS